MKPTSTQMRSCTSCGMDPFAEAAPYRMIAGLVVGEAAGTVRVGGKLAMGVTGRITENR